MARKKDDNPNGREVISGNKLKKLLTAARGTKSDVGTIVKAMADKIDSAVENDHLDKRAFKIVQGLDRLSPETLNVTMENLDHYLDASGLRERAASAPALGLEEGGDEGNETENEEKVRARVAKAFPQSAGEARD